MKQQLMAYLDVLGLAAGLLTTVSYMPQIIKTWKSKSAKDVSLVMLIVLALGILLWVVYGYCTDSFPIIAANLATLVLIAVILALKYKFRQGDHE